MLKSIWLCFSITKRLVLNLHKVLTAICVSKSLSVSTVAWDSGVKKTTSDACIEVSYSQQTWPMLSTLATQININQVIHQKYMKELFSRLMLTKGI